MSTMTERRIIKEVDEELKKSSQSPGPSGGSPISGILKGGRLWKQPSSEIGNVKVVEPQQVRGNVNFSL